MKWVLSVSFLANTFTPHPRKIPEKVVVGGQAYPDLSGWLLSARNGFVYSVRQLTPMSRKTISVAITDDHQIVIDGITALLQGHPQIRIIHTATSGKTMLQLLKSEPVDVLLTDIMMPEMTGQELAKAVKQAFPETRILALSMSGQGDIVNEMINEADIAGYVLKNISKQDLIAAIEKVASGGIYFSEEVLNELARFDQVAKENETAQLTAREIEIIRLIEKELSNKAIAEKLFISERTVETHRKNIFRKTNAGSVLGLIKYAYQHKLIQS